MPNDGCDSKILFIETFPFFDNDLIFQFIFEEYFSKPIKNEQKFISLTKFLA